MTVPLCWQEQKESLSLSRLLSKRACQRQHPGLQLQKPWPLSQILGTCANGNYSFQTRRMANLVSMDQTYRVPCQPLQVRPCNFPSVTYALPQSKGTDCLLQLLSVRHCHISERRERASSKSFHLLIEITKTIFKKVMGQSREVTVLKPWKEFSHVPVPNHTCETVSEVLLTH